MSSVPRPPRWYMILVRAGLVTFIGTLLSFAITLLLGIVGTILVSALRHIHPDMRVAYRHVALPAAMVAGAMILVFSLAMEIRYYRQSRTLAAIARIS